MTKKNPTGPGSGGARAGAGRPAGPVEVLRQQMTVRLPGDAVAALEGLALSNDRSRGDIVAAALLAFADLAPIVRSRALDRVERQRRARPPLT